MEDTEQAGARAPPKRADIGRPSAHRVRRGPGRAQFP